MPGLVTGACTLSSLRLRLSPGLDAPLPRRLLLPAPSASKPSSLTSRARPSRISVRETSPSSTTAWRRKSTAPTGRSNAPPAVGPVAPASEIKDDADEERAAKEPGTRLIALYLDEYHVSAGESTERVRAAVSRFIDEQVRPGDLLVVMKPLDHLNGHPLHARSRRGAEGRQQLQRTPQRLHAAHAVRGAVSRSVAWCGARRARADRHVRLARAGRPGWASSTAGSRRHRADERGVHRRRAARARAATARSSGARARGEPVPRAAVRLRSRPDATPALRRRRRD